MRIDILARRWGSPEGGPDGMAAAVSYLAWQLCELGHNVRGYVGSNGAPSWTHPRMEWRCAIPLFAPDDWNADLVISTISAAWRRTATAADQAGTRSKLFYWRHHAEPPPGMGCRLIDLKPGPLPDGWTSISILSPSNWAIEKRGSRIGDAIVVPGASRAKGGHVAVEVAKLVTDRKWYVLPGRGSGNDLVPWSRLPHVEIAPAWVPTEQWLARATAVLCPTRVECYGGLALVEAAVRGIPVVCTDMPETRVLGEVPTYLSVVAPPDQWATALREALASPARRLDRPPYVEEVRRVIDELAGLVAASAHATPAAVKKSPPPPPPEPPKPAARLPRLPEERKREVVRLPPVARNPDGKPRILILADVPNWAWARKAANLKRWLSSAFDITIVYGCEPQVGEVIRRRDHDLYHTFEVVQTGAIPVGFPLVTGITAHVAANYDRQRGPGTVKAWSDRALGFHANSRMLQRELHAYLGREIYYVPNGVDEEFWKRSRPRQANKLIVGHVARPNPRKGADAIRRACQMAGVELRSIDRSSKNAMSAEEMRSWYQEIHVLAVQSDMDGTPNPALEAAACECAVVSNPIGNMPEFISHGNNGLMTERSAESLAAALSNLAAMPLRDVEEMGRNARKTILDAWTWAKQAPAYGAMWRACL